MDWNSDKVLELLDLYKNYPLLWEPNHQDYKDRIKRKSAYIEMGKYMEISSEEIESKINRLRSQYNRELVKIIESKRAGNSDDVYSPKWFAFELMGQFMCGSVPKKIYEVSKDAEPPKFITLNEDRIMSNSMETSERHKRFKKKKKRSFHEEHKRSHVQPEYNNITNTKSDETSEFIKALKALNNNEGTPQNRDEYTIFGEHVACQIRRLNNPRLQAMAKHRIATVLYEIELKNIDEQNGTESGHTE